VDTNWHGSGVMVQSSNGDQCKKNLTNFKYFSGNNKSNKGWTPLHLASYFGHYEVVKVLTHVSISL
jgi:ankyrin repeat protein